MSDSSHPTVKRTQLFEALAVMAFAAAMYGVTFTFEKVPPFLAQGIQPTVFPRAILILMFILAMIQAIKAARLTPQDLSFLKPHKHIPKIVYLTALMLILLPVLMPIIGTFPAFAVFLPALSFLWGERRWTLMALSFAGFTAFVYVLFRLIMNVPLP
jgi:hypothetical protein